MNLKKAKLLRKFVTSTVSNEGNSYVFKNKKTKFFEDYVVKHLVYDNKGRLVRDMNKPTRRFVAGNLPNSTREPYVTYTLLNNPNGQRAIYQRQKRDLKHISNEMWQAVKHVMMRTISQDGLGEI